MASFRKVGRNWQAVVKREGKRITKVHPTKAAALAWADQIERGVIPGRTLRAALERYRDEVSAGKRGERWERLRLEKFMREWSAIDRDITTIGRADITAWRDDRLKEVSHATVRREMGLLSHVFRLACHEWGWISEIPTATVGRPKNSAPRTRTFSDDEIARIVHALGFSDGHFDGQMSASQQTAVCFLLALETAMRSGEVLALRWEHVRERAVHVPKTKTDAPRDVPLTIRARELLSYCRGQDEETVFTLAGSTRDTLFRRAMAKAGVEGATFHDSRRTATSRLAKKVDVLTLAKITGHKDLKLLMAVYYSVNMDDVADKLD